MIDLIRKLKNKHHITKIFIDASNAGFISTLKQQSETMTIEHIQSKRTS